MSFNEIIGQKEVKKLLEKSLKKGRIASSYLFCGPEGVGKTITSFNFAKAMNCRIHKTDSCPNDTSAKKCPSCRKIDLFSHPDVKILFPVPKKIREENSRNELLKEGKIHIYQKTEVISIDDVRDVEEMLLMKPFDINKRVVIIIDAEAMTEEAQNAFLKVLEEPPRDTTIILTSSQPERLFSTIRSRCQKITFKRLSREEIKGYLLKKEKLTDEEIDLICLLSNGSIENVMEFLDEDRIVERELLKTIVIKKDYEKLSETFNKESLEKFISFLLPLFRDINIVMTGDNLLNPDIENYVRSVHKKYSMDELINTVELLGNSLINISRNINPELISNVVYDRLKEG